MSGNQCVCSDASPVSDLLSAIPKALGLNPGSQPHGSSGSSGTLGSWAPEIQEELDAWRQEHPGKAEPRGLISSASKALEDFLFEDGVPTDVAPFSAATPQQVAEKVILHLYTQPNGDRIINGSGSNLVNQGFHPNSPTILLIHGYGHNVSGAAVQPIKDRILATATGPVNVIGVDWGALCPSPYYIWARANVKPTGEYLGHWLAQLIRDNLLRPSDIHVVGHSLGAHVAGTAGAATNEVVGEKIARVTGLDPAYPLFARATPNSGKIANTDAKLVDVIHTAIGRLGLREAVGHVDFFVNGGHVPQPGCGVDLSASCSHERVCFLFAESVGRPTSFPGTHCSAGEAVKEENCTGVLAHMGYNGTFSEPGKYYVKTKGEEPYTPT